MAMMNIVRASLLTPGTNDRWGLPLCFQGKPGSGKTSRLTQEAKSLSMMMQTVIASLREPSDFLGLPIPRKGKDGQTMVEFAPPGWARELATEKRGLLFLDEINTAPPAVQAALLRVIFDGVVGDLDLGPGIRFLSAMNATEDAAGGWDLAPPLANRFGHISWDPPDVEDWGDWLLSGAKNTPTSKPIDLEAEEARVMKAWPNAWARSRGLIAGFMRRRPELMLKMPQAGDKKLHKAWPSPRTWEMAARALAGSEVHGLDDNERGDFIAAFVGAEPMAELESWLVEADLPDPVDVLDGKVKFKHDPQRLDRTAAVLSACAAFIAPEKSEKRNSRAEKLWGILASIKDAKDIIVPASRVLVRSKLAQSKAARPVLLDIQPILAAANVRPQ